MLSSQNTTRSDRAPGLPTLKCITLYNSLYNSSINAFTNDKNGVSQYNVVLLAKKGGGGAMTTFGDLGNYVNEFTPSPHDF